MCRDCGCGLVEPSDHGHDHDRGGDGDGHHHHSAHEHDHDHPHDHGDRGDRGDRGDDAATRTVAVRRRILEANDELATRLRADFRANEVLAVNLVGSPGAGKTELLARTMTGLAGEWSVAAVTGDLATENDAVRLAATGAPARQILTGTMCHLEADMVAGAIADWDLPELDVLFIENVGNLVCPGDFDLGEDLRVMVVATTEGEDKPLKYPTMTISSDVAVINKIDLAEAVGCDVDRLERHLRTVRPDIEVVRLSARTGEGMDRWLDLLGTRTRVGSTPAG